MVELAIILPVLLLILFAIAEMGLLFNRWLTLSNAAREGARLATVYRPNCDADTVKGLVIQRVLDFVEAGSINRDIVTVSFSDSSITDNVCSGSGDQVLVRASMNFDFLYIPGLSEMRGGSIGNSSIPVGHSAVMRNE